MRYFLQNLILVDRFLVLNMFRLFSTTFDKVASIKNNSHSVNIYADDNITNIIETNIKK